MCCKSKLLICMYVMPATKAEVHDLSVFRGGYVKTNINNFVNGKLHNQHCLFKYFINAPRCFPFFSFSFYVTLCLVSRTRSRAQATHPTT